VNEASLRLEIGGTEGLIETAVIGGEGEMCQGVEKEGFWECGVTTHSRWLV
jgi:hypothetical protein